MIAEHVGRVIDEPGHACLSRSWGKGLEFVQHLLLVGLPSVTQPGNTKSGFPARLELPKSYLVTTAREELKHDVRITRSSQHCTKTVLIRLLQSTSLSSSDPCEPTSRRPLPDQQDV